VVEDEEENGFMAEASKEESDHCCKHDENTETKKKTKRTSIIKNYQKPKKGIKEIKAVIKKKME